MPINEDARALAEVMIESGREPMWVVLVVSWYYGSVGRDVALGVVGDKLLTSSYNR